MKSPSPIYAVIFAGSCAVVIALSGACVDTNDPGTSPSSSTSSSASSSSTTSSSSSGDVTTPVNEAGTDSSSSSSSGTVQPDNAKVLATAGCEAEQKCFPKTFAAKYATVDECVTTQLADALPAGKLPPGLKAPDLAACAAKVKTAKCADDTPIECVATGTLANGIACDFGDQCTTGNCVMATPDATCGKCAVRALEGEACLNSTCAAGLRCDFAAVDPKCVKTLADGADCANENAFNCAPGLTCVGAAKKCGKPREIDELCTTDQVTVNDCRSGLECVNEKCADVAPKLVKLGGACGNGVDDAFCVRSSCVSSKCVAYAKVDEACRLNLDEPKPDCGDNLFCVGATVDAGVDAGSAGKCKTYGKLDAACDDTDFSKPPCDFGLDLECKANKCTAITYCK